MKNRFLKINFGKKGKLGRQFFDRNSASKKKFVSRIGDKIKFLQTFEEEMKVLMPLLASEERLWKDFQVLVDTDGRIYHIDLDRIEQAGMNSPSEKETHNCFRRIIANILKMLGEQNISTNVKK